MERDLVVLTIMCVAFCVAVGFLADWFERAVESLPDGWHKRK